jgi:hypothetical protein
MLISFYRQFSQGLYVAGCATSSAITLGYMIFDAHKMEKKQLQNEYEKTIKLLNNEIKILTKTE